MNKPHVIWGKISDTAHVSAKMVRAEASRLRGVYVHSRRRKPGPEPGWDIFVAVAYLRLKTMRSASCRTVLTKADLGFLERELRISADQNKVNRWMRGRLYRRLCADDSWSALRKIAQKVSDLLMVSGRLEFREIQRMTRFSGQRTLPRIYLESLLQLILSKNQGFFPDFTRSKGALVYKPQSTDECLAKRREFLNRFTGSVL